LSLSNYRGERGRGVVKLPAVPVKYKAFTGGESVEVFIVPTGVSSF